MLSTHRTSIELVKLRELRARGYDPEKHFTTEDMAKIFKMPRESFLLWFMKERYTPNQDEVKKHFYGVSRYGYFYDKALVDVLKKNKYWRLAAAGKYKSVQRDLRAETMRENAKKRKKKVEANTRRIVVAASRASAETATKPEIAKPVISNTTPSKNGKTVTKTDSLADQLASRLAQYKLARELGFSEEQAKEAVRTGLMDM